MGTAVRELFYVRRTLKSQPNDSSHLQKNLSKYGLKWEDISTSINLKL
jgi:transcriptional regulatory protein RtcR